MSAVLKPPPAAPIELPANAPADLLGETAQIFLSELHHRFESTRQALLSARRRQQARYDAGCATAGWKSPARSIPRWSSTR